MITVAVAQFCAVEDVESNLEQAVGLITAAATAGARLVVLPESSLCPPPGIFDPTPVAQSIDGPFSTAIADTARRVSVGVVFGMFTPAPHGRIFNTVLAVAPDGELIARYDKLHLYDAFSMRESNQVVPGPATAGTPAVVAFEIDGMRFGIATCYDLRFPELFRALVDLSAEAIVLPAAWIVGPQKHLHWSTLTRARAIESSLYLVASDQTGPTAIGCSTIIGPDGGILADAGSQPGFVLASLDNTAVAEVRVRNPSVFNRRFAVTLRDSAPIPREDPM